MPNILNAIPTRLQMPAKNKLKHRLVDYVRAHPHVRDWLGHLLHLRHLWHFNRRSVANATAIGLLWAFVPIPFQMVFAGFTAVYFRTNLPVAVAYVWVSNPLTIPPLTYFCHRIGQLVLNIGPTAPPEWTTASLLAWMTGQWRPFFVGCAIVGVACASIGYTATRLIWAAAVRVKSARRTARRRG